MTTISDDIRSVSAALGMLAGRLSSDDWALLLLARDNLASLAEQVEGLEQCLVPAAVPTPPTALPLAVTAQSAVQGSPVQAGDACARLQ